MKAPKHIVITGASSGIGYALALEYAAPDVRLALTGRNAERLSEIVQACSDKGAAVVGGHVDVADREGMARWLLEQDGIKPVDLIIANAGISGGTGGVMSGEAPDQVRRIFDINLIGVLNTIEPLLPLMIERKRGQVALMASLAGFRGWPGAPAYCSSKAAVKVYGEGLRGALASSGVEVNVICPGFVESRMTAVNNFSMPFLISAKKAARMVSKGLSQNKGRIAFPLPTHFLAWFFGTIPDCLSQFLLAFMPSKGVEKYKP